MARPAPTPSRLDGRFIDEGGGPPRTPLPLGGGKAEPPPPVWHWIKERYIYYLNVFTQTLQGHILNDWCTLNFPIYNGYQTQSALGLAREKGHRDDSNMAPKPRLEFQAGFPFVWVSLESS